MKKLKILILLLILCPLNVFAASYFDNQELTAITTSRAKAQMQVQAIAEEYLYKNLYTDYEQKNQDTYDISVKNNDYTVSDSDNTLSKTFSYRNLNMTPFDLSRSNYNVFDCSSFVSNVYLNAFGFDFREYFNLKLDGKNIYNHTYVNKNSSNTISIDYNSSKYNRDAFMHSGKTIYTASLEKMQKSLSPNIDNTKAKDNKNSLFVYKYENANGITLSQLNNLKNYLQTGDILLYRRKLEKKENGKTKTYTSGHVMLYIEDYKGNNGFIHSTGKDFNYVYEYTTEEEFGVDPYSVRFTKFSSKYSKSNEVEVNSKGYKTYYVTIIRPINIVLNSTYTNAYTNTKDKKTAVNIDNLRDMYSKGYNLSMQQYLYNNTQKKYLNSSNVINNGDEVSVKAFIKNKGTAKKSFTITMPYSEQHMEYKIYGCKSTGANNETISKCSDMSFVTAHKDVDNKKVTFAVELNPEQYIYTYYKFKYVHSGSSQKNTLTIPGMTLSYDSKQIKFNDLTMTGENSNLSAYSSVISKINRYYLEDGEKINRSKSLLRMYQDVFDIDFSSGTPLAQTDSKTNATVHAVIKGLFTDKLDEQEGIYYNPTNTELKKYVVPGMYGGKIVRGNLDNIRTHQLNFEQLEPGDIVVAYNNASNKEYRSFMFVYGGYKEKDDEKQYTIYLRQKKVYIVRKRALNLLKRAWASEAFVVLRPSQVTSVSVDANSNYDSSINPRIETIARIIDNIPDDTDDIMTSDEDETVTPSTTPNTTIDEEEDTENYNDTFIGNKEDIEAEEEDDGYIENRLESPKTSIGQEIINNIPDTAVFKSKLAIVIGLISLILGIIIIKQNMKKTNKN